MEYDNKFEYAINLVLRHEGGYVNDPHDIGGETNFGLSKRSYPELDIKNLTVDQAKDIYYHDWWIRYNYRSIDDNHLAAKVLDLSVNIGPYHAHTLLQGAVCRSGTLINVDGILGPRTYDAINALDATALLDKFQQSAIAYYETLTEAHPVLSRYLQGWINRVNDL